MGPIHAVAAAVDGILERKFNEKIDNIERLLASSMRIDPVRQGVQRPQEF